jgi:thioredoxin 1
MASDNVKVFTDSNFDQEVLRSTVPVLVEFTATWCGPCKALAPVIDQVAAALEGKAKVGKVDIEESSVTAGKCGVHGVPTVMVFKNGERVAQHVGLTTKARLLELVNA